ncbi:RNA polymerase sigma factor [Phocaeicola sp.]
MMNQEQIKELIDKSRKNDAAAFARLVSEYQGMVFRLAFRLLCDEDETRDMVQETFVKIWLSINKYDGTCRFSTWIYKITCNTCYDRLRALQRSPSAYSSDSACTDWNMKSEENIEEVLANKELASLILRFTEELTPKQKLVFTLRDIEGLEVAEVVTITGLSAEKIKHNLYQARKQIRNKIHQIEPDL